jgi:hypothetical protein
MVSDERHVRRRRHHSGRLFRPHERTTRLDTQRGHFGTSFVLTRRVSSRCRRDIASTSRANATLLLYQGTIRHGQRLRTGAAMDREVIE